MTVESDSTSVRQIACENHAAALPRDLAFAVEQHASPVREPLHRSFHPAMQRMWLSCRSRLGAEQGEECAGRQGDAMSPQPPACVS